MELWHTYEKAAAIFLKINVKKMAKNIYPCFAKANWNSLSY